MKDIEGIPEGWKLVRIGAVHKNEYYLDHNGDPCKRIGGQSDCANCPIIEKEHKEPELLYGSNGSGWYADSSKLWKSIRNLDLKQRGPSGEMYDVMATSWSYDKTERLYLGHWNDGVRGDA